MKKLTGGFKNGLGAILIGEHSLLSFLSRKSPEGISGLFQQHRPIADVGPNRNLRPVWCHFSPAAHLQNAKLKQSHKAWS